MIKNHNDDGSPVLQFLNPKTYLGGKKHASLHSDILKIQASDLVYLGVYDVSLT